MLVLGMLSLSLSLAWPQALLGQTVKLNLNAKYGANNFHTKGAEEYAKLVKKYSKNSVEIVVHAGSSLVKGDALEAVKNGTVAMTDMFIPFTAGGGKIFGISALPFIANSYDEAFRLYEASKPAYQKTAKKWNQKFLYAVSWPPSGFYSKKKVAEVADFKGLKTRTYDKNSAAFINKVGASAIALPWGEVYSALRTGLVDSVVTSSASGNDGKFWEVLNYFTQINYAYPLQGVTINLDYWNSLSPSQKKAMLKAAQEIEAIQWTVSKKEDERAKSTLLQNGLEINQIDANLKQKLDAVASTLLKDYLKDSDAQLKNIFTTYKNTKDKTKY